MFGDEVIDAPAIVLLQECEVSAAPRSASCRSREEHRGACWNQGCFLSSAMLYTRFVIREETLSSGRVFNFYHWVIFSTTIKSFIEGHFNGHYRKPGPEHTSVCRGNIAIRN